jgi:hypothetical protein
MLDARTVQNHQSTINLEYGALATLKPMLAKMAQDKHASADVHACNDALNKGQSTVNIDVLVKALPEVIFNVYKANEAVRSVQSETDLAQSSAAKDVMSALRALKLIKDGLASVKNDTTRQNSHDFQIVLQALQDMLADMPEGTNDDAMDYVRFLSSTTGLGIRQILVGMAGCIDTIGSKLDECCFSLDSKLDKVDDDVLSCCFTLESKIDGINVSTDFAPCCFTINSKLDQVEEEVLECCFTLGSKIDNIPTNDFGTCCSTIETLITDCCETVNSKLDILLTSDLSTPCASTPIFGATTISVSGSYCLANNVTSALAQTILISAVSDVVLDLNGHTVSNTSTTGSGIVVSGGGVNTIIKNGFVRFPTGGNTGAGILLQQGSSQSTIQNVTVSFWRTGIYSEIQSAILDTVVDLNFGDGIIINGGPYEISRCRILNNTGDGITVDSGQGKISDVEIFNAGAGTSCLSISSALGSVVNNCKFTHVNGNGVLVDNVGPVEINNCAAYSNGTTAGTGFNLDADARNVLINNCYATGFTAGFLAVSEAQLNLENSVAKGNGTGFLMGSSTVAILRNNTADFNVTGFQGTSSQQYYSNVACNNAVNFSGIVPESVTSPANARGVHNVDCSSFQPDQVGQTLSKVDVLGTSLFTCCSTLEVLVANSEFTVSSLIDGIEECCYTVDSKIDRIQNCCFTVNSKVDEIQTCCFDVNSKTDIILADTVGTSSAVGNVLDKSSDLCCFTSTCDIDNANLSVISWLKTIYRDMRGFTTPTVGQCTVGSCEPAVCPQP